MDVADSANAPAKFQSVPVLHRNVADNQGHLIFPEHFLRLSGPDGAQHLVAFLFQLQADAPVEACIVFQ